MRPRGSHVCTVAALCVLAAWPHSARAQAPTDPDVAELVALLNTRVSVVSKTSERLLDAPGLASVITREELRRFGGTSLFDVLTRVPGLTAASGYLFDRSMIVARGDIVRTATTNRHTLVLLDGRPIREVQEGGIKSEFYESFPIDAIDRIEVIKGPGSVLYGSEAFSAVINVVTRVPTDNRGSVTTAIGKGGAHNITGTGTIVGRDWSLLFSGRRAEKADWPITYSWSNVSNGAPVVSAQRIFPHETTGTVISGSIKRLRFATSLSELRTGYMLPDSFGIPATGPSTVIGENLWRAGLFDVTYSDMLAPRWKMTASLTHNRSWLDVASGTFPNVKRDSFEILSEVTNFVELSPAVKLTAGALYSRVHGTEIFKTVDQVISKGSRDSFAQYAQVDYQATDTTKLTTGFQVLEVRGQTPTVVPRAGIVWQPASNVGVKLLYGEAYRAPYVNELTISHPGLVGNRGLRPERVRSAEAGVTYALHDLEVTASYFNNRQTQIIGYDFTPMSPDRPQYINAGKANIHGLEVESDYVLTPALFLSGSLLIQDADVESGVPDRSAKAGISYRTGLTTLSVFSIFQGPVSEGSYNPQSSNPRPEAYALVYTHAALNLSRALDLERGPTLEMFLQGDNVLNREVWLPNAGNPWPDVLPFNKGRALQIGLKASFSR